jgi:dihydroflavonol-4-reductase
VALVDTVEGIRLVLDRGTRGRRYLLSESTWRLGELLRLASRAAGRSGPRGRVPPPVWRALVAALAVLDRISPAEHATPEALALLGRHFRFRARRAREELGWTPRPFPEVLAEIVAWMRAGGRP